MRNALLILSLAAAVWTMPPAARAAGTTQPANLAPLLSPDEATAIDTVIAAMLKAGFPDAQHAEVYAGKLLVQATFDATRDAMPLPSDASNMQESIPGSKQVKYGYTFDGLHFKLADGSWIIAVSYHFVPRKGDVVDVSGAAKVNLATLTAEAIAAHAVDSAKSNAGFLAMVAPAQRERSRRAMDELSPVIGQLQVPADGLPAAVVLLRRAGWDKADDMCLAIADIRMLNYWQMRPWTAPDPPFDPTGKYAALQQAEQDWKKTQTTYTAEPPAIALRRALFRVCRAQLTMADPESPLLPADVAAAAAKAVVDDNDPQGNIARIDALVAGGKLPVALAAGAALDARLQSWEAGPRQPKMVVSSGGGGNNISFSTAFVAPPPAYVPVKEDLDALVALLADQRPSRFFDFTGARSVGDNAWRAVTELLKADPRTLAAYPTDHPWTAAERLAASKAVQGWWAQHRTDYVGK